MPQNRMRQEPSQDRSRKSVDLILDTAAALFVELGYEAVTTNAIAGRSGISIGSLYRYFPDKASILQAWAVRYLQQLRALYDRLFTEDLAYLPLPVILDRLIDPFVDFCTAKPAYKQLLLGCETSKEIWEVAKELEAYSTQRILQMLRLMAPDADSRQLEIAGAICNAMVKGLISLIAASRDAEYQRRATSEMKVALAKYLEPIVTGAASR